MLASNVAFASNNTTEAGSTATSEVELTMEVATVPTGLIVAVQANGDTITATEANIVNNSHAPIMYR